MPILGFGAGCAPLRLSSIYSVSKGVHNTYLNMFLETSFLCLPVFIAMLVDLFRKLIKNKRAVEIAALAGICVVIFFLDSYAKKFFWNLALQNPHSNLL